jgi:hypothetical protein
MSAGNEIVGMQDDEARGIVDYTHAVCEATNDIYYVVYFNWRIDPIISKM